MKTITLEEALKRATDGPLEVSKFADAPGYAIGFPWIASVTGGDDKINAALLAHCYNVLPKVVEALKFYANEENWKVQYSGIGEFPSEAESDGGEKARAALANANTVTLP